MFFAFRKFFLWICSRVVEHCLVQTDVPAYKYVLWTIVLYNRCPCLYVLWTIVLYKAMSLLICFVDHCLVQTDVHAYVLWTIVLFKPMSLLICVVDHGLVQTDVPAYMCCGPWSCTNRCPCGYVLLK